MLYTLVARRAIPFYAADRRIRVVAEMNAASAALPAFKDKLSALAYRKYGTKPGSVDAVEIRPAADEPVLQLLALALGAVLEARSGTCRDGGRASLARRMTAMADCDLAQGTRAFEKRFNVWTLRSWARDANAGDEHEVDHHAVRIAADETSAAQ